VRRYKAIRLEDLARLSGSVKRVRPFVICEDWRPVTASDDIQLEARMRAAADPRPVQMTLF
jgi:predicted DNA-binding helix-hairpin-helix protein